MLSIVLRTLAGAHIGRRLYFAREYRVHATLRTALRANEPRGANGPADTPGSVRMTRCRVIRDGHLSRDYVAAAL